LSLRPRINRRRRRRRRRCRRRPFIRILGSARVQMQVILLFKNKFIRIFCLLEAAVTEQLFRVRFYSKKKGFINRGYLYIFISQGYQGILDCLALAKRVSIKKRSPIYDYVTFFGVSVRQI
jgi:hypothetical protein